MNDPLKKYVQEHRDEFDHLEPSGDILLKLKGNLKIQKKEKKGIIRLRTNYKWMVAAAILITASITYLLVPKFDTADLPKNVATKVTAEQNSAIDKAIDEQTQPAQVVKPTAKAAKKKPQEEALNADLLTAYYNLTDSTSASNRLSAILAIEKSTIVSYDIIDRLTQTLNYDSNSNVRLAALNLMSKYAQDSYVSNAFMQSLNNQKDPLVQLGLIDLLSQTNNPKFDDKLYALANDPTTLAAVKDQAYLILLNQNKL
jgi:energy-converting hydrogenase A subunit M